MTLRVLYGQFADEAFRSLRVTPGALLAAGYPFQQPDLRAALTTALQEHSR